MQSPAGAAPLLSSHRLSLRLLPVLLPALGAMACGGDASPAPANVGALAEAFEASAHGAGVPRDLLVAIAVTEGGLDLPAHRAVEEANEVPAAGPLMLRRGKLDTLARGATLAGTTELALRQDRDLALHAAALVVADLAAKNGAAPPRRATRTPGAPDDWASWEATLEDLSGYADDLHRKDYAHRVFRALARGGRFALGGGAVVSLVPRAVPLGSTLDPRLEEGLHLDSPAEFPGAEWIPTSCANKCTTTREGPIGTVVIHDTEGGWDASVATLQNDPGKSVHYIVDTTGRVAQFVKESVAAWHSGNHFYNHRSVGIEHVGYSRSPYTEKEYAASATLVTYLARKYHVAVDRSHVIGHEQVPGNGLSQDAAPCLSSPTQCEANASYGGAGHHTDPGIWEWATYMPRVRGEAKCNDASPTFRCGWDGKAAYRCTGGHVTVETCTSCAMQNGAATCATGAGGSGGAGVPSQQGDGSVPSDIPPGSAIDESSGRPPPFVGVAEGDAGGGIGSGDTASTDAEADASGGCTVGRVPGPSDGTQAGGGLAAVLSIARRRRRTAPREDAAGKE